MSPDHFLEPEPDDRRLGVVSQLHSVAEAGSARHDVLERSTDLDGAGIIDDSHLDNDNEIIDNEIIDNEIIDN